MIPFARLPWKHIWILKLKFCFSMLNLDQMQVYNFKNNSKNKSEIEKRCREGAYCTWTTTVPVA